MIAKRNAVAIKKIYKWNHGGFNGVPAQVVGEELEKMEVRPGDYHKTNEVLDSARDTDHPLHQCFPWDDAKAAEQHRISVCRAMLRSISFVIVRNETRTTRPVYVHVSDEDGPRYVRAERVASESELRQRALDEALAMLNGLRRRFEFISELAPVFDALETVKKRRHRTVKSKRRTG